ncbi:diguanylate cyclase [Sorangium cellulosum]|uniref:Diguanylate cyclase n=1 Tax=Sorangium cellulosum TaxID=56 RepID=A0A4P2PUH1_SORCE|nr:PAS domain-containing protein [Sorangium cellulosum]AUX20337.1 diguanylate cyclase [Sorangium cellulosum]
MSTEERSGSGVAFTLPCIEVSDWTTFELLQLVIDTIPDPIFVKDRQHRWIACNQGFCRLIGQRYEDLIGRSDPDYWPKEQADVFWAHDDAVFSSGEPRENEELATGADGVTRTIWTRKFPMRNAQGDVVGLCGLITDITELKRRHLLAERMEAENREQRAIISAQAALLDRVAMPVIQVWEGILLIPLVGEINDRRAAQALESLLGAIGQRSAEFVILDITGVPVIDAAVARHLIRAVQAAELLGCQSVMVGVGPEIAKTLIGLGIDFGRISTQSTLQSGLAYAMARLGAMGRVTPARAP